MFRKGAVTRDNCRKNQVYRQGGTWPRLFVKILLLHSIVSAGPSKHLFTKHLLFHLHVNSSPLKSQTTTLKHPLSVFS